MLRCLLRGSRTAPYSSTSSSFTPTKVPSYSRYSRRGPRAIKSRTDRAIHTVAARRHHGTAHNHLSRSIHRLPNPQQERYFSSAASEDPQEASRDSASGAGSSAQPDEHSSYFADTSVRVRDIERVLSNPTLTGEILDKLQSETVSDSDANAVRSLVRSAVDFATSSHSHDAYNFVMDVWHIVFHEYRHKESLKPIRATLQHSEDRIIHIMLNRGDYAAYQALIEPLYEMRPSSLRSWPMTLMETIRPAISRQVYTVDSRKMSSFLNSDQVSREQKHRLIAIFLTKALLSSRSLHNVQNAISEFVSFVISVEDTTFSLSSSLFHIYRRPLALFAETTTEAGAKARLEMLWEIFEAQASLPMLSNFLTALSRAAAESHPFMAISCWDYKASVLNPAGGIHVGKKTKDSRNKSDLTSTMIAYIQLRAYDKALSVYTAHDFLQDDDQITLLLKSSEKAKDWKLLQKQFEDMYGRGNLPYVMHYAVVMGALASIGATTEVEQLYAQLLRRKLEPTAPIFLALIRSNINANNHDAAVSWFKTFMDAVDSGSIDRSHVSALQLEVFESRLPQMTVSAAMNELELLAAKQADTQIPLISSSTISTMIRFVSSLYSLQGFNTVWKVAEQFALVDDHVYSEAMSFLTKMGQFKRADDLAFEAQVNSPVPFQNSLILAYQLRNYRQWRKQITDKETNRLLSQRIFIIINQVEKGNVTPKNLGHLLVEVIIHYTSVGKPEMARPFLDKANSMNISNERHFIPFLKEYSSDGSYEDNSDVLALYREMVSRKTAITARTYYYLSKSLLMIDTANKNDHKNSLNLLQSVLEMYGFSISDDKSTNRVSVSDLARNAVFLLQIVSNYAIEASAQDEDSMNLVLNFLKQIRMKLDKNVDYNFRVSILTEMSKVYRVYGDLQVAGSLVDNAIKEMDEIIDQLPSLEPLPKLLQLDYRKAVDLKLSVLNQTKALPREYERLLKHVLSKNVRLSGYQFHGINQRVLKSVPVSKETLNLVLDSCERFLVSGNWSEVKLNRKIHYIYRIYLVYLGRTMSAEAISERYDILNQLYNIKNVQAVLDKFQDLRSPRLELEKALEEYSAISPKERWSPDRFFENLAEFFSPERKLDTKNFIQPNIAAGLVQVIEKICHGDKTIAFALYDEYPETMEYLLFYVEERTRVVSFRLGIDKMIGSGGSAPVDGREARRQLSIETLQHLWGQ
ncbi:hypothetical protein JCM33374_g2663 [Metschnikowia sp. JCM 33374]|nr:hypothetical protein JCM33374_g2663 [Metschnikowia sp. JCM 33374]